MDTVDSRTRSDGKAELGKEPPLVSVSSNLILKIEEFPGMPCRQVEDSAASIPRCLQARCVQVGAVTGTRHSERRRRFLPVGHQGLFLQIFQVHVHRVGQGEVIL